jgi:hypothetical protein
VEKIFLSYTYRSHPDHEADLDRLRRYVVRTIEAMGLRVVDGVDVGGRPLDAALEARIGDSDALVALITPQAADGTGEAVEPAFVLTEFQYARGLRKPTMGVLQDSLTLRGLGATNEHAPYAPGKELWVVLKLMNTIALWKRACGHKARVRIEPEDLAARYDETQGDRCFFQVISPNGGFRDFERAVFFLEPGAAYALLPNVREGERVRLRLQQGGSTWQSKQAIDPFVGGVTLERRP